MKNWKTTIAGIVAILGAATDVLHGISTGNLGAINWQMDAAAVSGGIGLIFAKDGSTHSTTAEVQTATTKAQP